MSELPIGWEWSTIGELTLDIEKHDPRKSPDQQIEYIDIGGIDGGRLQIESTKQYTGGEAPSRARQLVRAGDTVLSTVRINLTKTALVPSSLHGATASTGFSVLRPCEAILPELLFHQVTHRPFVNSLAELQTGSSYPAVRDRDVRAMGLVVPPLREQRRIVAAIEEHFSRLDAAEAGLRDALRRNVALSRSVFSLANESHWPEVRLGDLIEKIEAGKSFKTPGRPAEDGEWGVIKVSAMTWGEFDESENKAVLDTDRIDERYEIRPGDLLLSRANTSELVGAVVLVDQCRTRLLLSDKSMRLHTAPGVDRKWLRYCLGSPALRSQMSAVASGTSDSMRNISQAKVRALRVHAPDSETQKRVAAELTERLNEVERMASEIEAAKYRAAALRRSILAAAFSGQLVSQDSSDEPASALLERIAAESAASKPTRKKKKASS